MKRALAVVAVLSISGCGGQSAAPVRTGCVARERRAAETVRAFAERWSSWSSRRGGSRGAELASGRLRTQVERDARRLTRLRAFRKRGLVESGRVLAIG